MRGYQGNQKLEGGPGSIQPEIGIRRVATSKDNDKLQKFGLYLSMYKEKWKSSVMKYDDE
jgi:hypothetical protein